MLVFQTEAASGILKSLQELGKRPGRDISLIGYDDLEVARIHHPPLTTLRPPAREAGKRAVEILMEVIGGPRGTLSGDSGG